MGTTIKLADGTVVKSRKCAACKTPMCFSGNYYYCPSKECEQFDVPQKFVEDSDIVRRGRPNPMGSKPVATVGPWCDVAVRRRKCSACGETVYVVTTNGATVTVCRCGVAVGAN